MKYKLWIENMLFLTVSEEESGPHLWVGKMTERLKLSEISERETWAWVKRRKAESERQHWQER